MGLPIIILTVAPAIPVRIDRAPLWAPPGYRRNYILAEQVVTAASLPGGTVTVFSQRRPQLLSGHRLAKTPTPTSLDAASEHMRNVSPGKRVLGLKSRSFTVISGRKV
jgi:hypothetical protein